VKLEPGDVLNGTHEYVGPSHFQGCVWGLRVKDSKGGEISPYKVAGHEMETVSIISIKSITRAGEEVAYGVGEMDVLQRARFTLSLAALQLQVVDPRADDPHDNLQMILIESAELAAQAAGLYQAKVYGGKA